MHTHTIEENFSTQLKMNNEIQYISIIQRRTYEYLAITGTE